MEAKHKYRFEDANEGQIERDHGKEVLELFRFVVKFVDEQLLQCVKTDFEFFLHGPNEDIITVTCGKGSYKFLATYDGKGNPTMRRFFGQSKLEARQSALYEKTVEEVNETAFFDFQQSVRKIQRPSYGPESNFDIEEDNSSKGLLCMKAAYFVDKKKISNDVEIVFFDGNGDLYKMKCGNSENKVLATFDKYGNPKVLYFDEKEYSLASEVNMYIYNKCTEISKITLGKMILEVCGNEGVVDDENNAFIRQRLQAIITYLKEEKDKVWENAAITFYDNKLNSLMIKAGTGEKKFVVCVDEKGKVSIV